MYIKVTRSGSQRYLQLATSQRGPDGHPRTKVLATLGRIDLITPREVDSVINGLLRATGRAELTPDLLRSLELKPADKPGKAAQK